jgi:hypothetical protein
MVSTCGILSLSKDAPQARFDGSTELAEVKLTVLKLTPMVQVLRKGVL